jgi:hypothetical protein
MGNVVEGVEPLPLDADPHESRERSFGGAGDPKPLPDTISDPGVEGGVDAPNEEPEEPKDEPGSQAAAS